MTHLALTIIVEEHLMAGEIPLYEAIVRKLVRLDIAGATVTPAVMGFGSHGKVHRKQLFGVTDERPLTIVAVDKAESIRHALPEIRAMVKDGLVYVSEVEVV